MNEAPIFSFATKEDLASMVALLADDDLGATREDARRPLDPAYRAALTE
jgi:hypothetical protein